MKKENIYMTPKEKAQEIFNKFYFAQDKDGFYSVSKYRARECAYIALDEIIGQWEYIDTYLANGSGDLNPNLKYWYEVKKEVQKITI